MWKYVIVGALLGAILVPIVGLILFSGEIADAPVFVGPMVAGIVLIGGLVIGVILGAVVGKLYYDNIRKGTGPEQYGNISDTSDLNTPPFGF
jgi:hypothetical protein